MERNRDLLIVAAQRLHQTLCPTSQITQDDILEKVSSWAFQVPPDPEVRIGPSQTRMSLVDDGPTKEFQALMGRIEKESVRSQNNTMKETGVQQQR